MKSGMQGLEADAELVQRVFHEDMSPGEAQRALAALPQFAGAGTLGPERIPPKTHHQPADEVVLSLQDSKRAHSACP